MNKYVRWFLLYSLVVFIILLIFNPTDLVANPLMTPQEYLNGIPYWNINLGAFDFVLIVPSSTFFVYVLGVVTILLGVAFLKNVNNLAQKWWGISMVLWGIGAILAGTSYQGLGYEVKCNGFDYCVFTSWFELSYLYVTALSIGALMIGTSYLVSSTDLREKLIRIAVISTLAYSVILLIGTVFSIQFLVTYELFTAFFLPHFTSFFVLSIIEYRKEATALHQKLIGTWILFLIVNVAYFGYFFAGIGPQLYENFKLWFSANDVLHIALLLWMIYIWVVVKPLISSYKYSE